MSEEIFNGNDYNELLLRAVAVIEQSRAAIARSIVTNITNSHWEIGKLLYERKLDSKYGAGVVKQLSADLKLRYPSMGLSTRQLWNMKKFYLRFYQADTKLQQAVALLPWKHTLMLMAGKFKPEYAGKMNYYLSILDRTERGEGENPSIGIILCAEKDHVDVELSLDGLQKPIGVADYRLVIPQEELKQLVQKEMEEFAEEEKFVCK